MRDLPLIPFIKQSIPSSKKPQINANLYWDNLMLSTIVYWGLLFLSPLLLLPLLLLLPRDPTAKSSRKQLIPMHPRIPTKRGTATTTVVIITIIIIDQFTERRAVIMKGKIKDFTTNSHSLDEMSSTCTITVSFSFVVFYFSTYF